MTKKRPRKTRRAPRKLNKRNLITLILAILVFFELAGTATGLIMVGSMLRDKPELEVDDFFSAESSHIFDKDGNQIADIGTQLRENITYNEMSEAVIDCFLAVEDSRYFKHDGFDMPRFIKAALVNVKNILTHNNSREGGSTFTMQLVKVTYFQNDETGETRSKDIEYKVEQIALARELERRSNKKAIFEMYLNKLNFGGTGNIRGIEMASQYYYGKHAGELNLAEAAMLAGVINSPYWYDPHNYLDYATRRRNTVLYQLMNHGYITKNEYNLAMAVNVEDTLIDPMSQRAGGRAYAYQSYIDSVIEEAEKLTGMDPYNVAMDIYTYMDPKVQQVMDDIQAGNYAEVVFPDDLMEIAMISENNQTGEIVAIGGGRNYGRGGSMLLNHATNQYKQPGSSVKPFLDYALAFEYLGWATSHVVTDRPIMYAGTNIIIKNANNSYYGQLPLEDAVGLSLNTPAIQALEEVINTAGWQTVVNYVTNLGFSQVSADNFDIGFAIGGSNFTCSAKELMAAHAVLMNGGNYIEPHTISRIEYRNGTQEPVVPQYIPKNVLTPQAAYLAASLMYTAVNKNYQNYLQILIRDYPVYGKTGTTDWGSEGLQYNIPQGASKDKWMVSETSQYTTAVWVGYEKGIKDQNTYFTNAKAALNIPGNISSLLVSVLNDGVNPAEVPRPDGISGISHIMATFPYASPVEGMESSLISYGLIKSDKANLVTAEQEPVETLNSFNAVYNDDGSVSFEWAPYPDAEKLTVAPDTMDISLYSGDNCLVWAEGRRMFDYSWLFGPIQYKVRVSQAGEVKGIVVSDSEYKTEGMDLLGGMDTEACGYYAYENDAQQSNEICVNFRTQDVPEDDKPEHTPEPEPETSAEPEHTPEPEPGSGITIGSVSDVNSAVEWCNANGISTTKDYNIGVGSFIFYYDGSTRKEPGETVEDKSLLRLVYNNGE